MRRFRLVRYRDASGVSGKGLVAEGVVFSSGTAVLQWLRGVADPQRHGATALYHSIDDVVATHGHNGRTVVVWLD